MTALAAAAASNAASVTRQATKTARAKFKVGAFDLNEEKNADLVIARHLWQDHRLLPPRSELRRRFQRALVLFALYSVFVIPMRVFFCIGTRASFCALEDPAMRAVEIVVDVCFWVDIVLNFRTALYTRDYELVYESKEIALRYMKSGWLFVDVLAAVPFDYFAGNWHYRSTLQFNRLFRITCAATPAHAYL